MERGKQRDEVGARRAEPCATRYVGHGRDLQAAGEAEYLERWPDEIVLDLVWRRHLLGEQSISSGCIHRPRGDSRRYRRTCRSRRSG